MRGTIRFKTQYFQSGFGQCVEGCAAVCAQPCNNRIIAFQRLLLPLRGGEARIAIKGMEHIGVSEIHLAFIQPLQQRHNF